ncbi:AAA family ATPase [Borreliella valaisiana]|uniref:AAA family ATPase n=1 Tax=Borreliella valaisiana TaxID=62088 RepID=UPI003B21ACC0
MLSKALSKVIKVSLTCYTLTNSSFVNYNFLLLIIDTPPSLSSELDNALVIANKVVIPVPLER